jgi:hypothetical protein
MNFYHGITVQFLFSQYKILTITINSMKPGLFLILIYLQVLPRDVGSIDGRLRRDPHSVAVLVVGEHGFHQVCLPFAQLGGQSQTLVHSIQVIRVAK